MNKIHCQTQLYLLHNNMLLPNSYMFWSKRANISLI